MPTLQYRDYGKFFDDFTVGEVYEHSITKTITESDNNLFCLLTMNHHPLHTDKEYAEFTRFKKLVVVGTYVLSLVVGMSVGDISGKAIANLDYEQVIHHAPVFIGDTLWAETEILTKRFLKTTSLWPPPPAASASGFSSGPRTKPTSAKSPTSASSPSANRHPLSASAQPSLSLCRAPLRRGRVLPLSLLRPPCRAS